MGMSASQARLLSITTRLNHIELESQNVSNSKIRLSQKTQDASDKYIKALNSTQLLYNTYDASGEQISQSLTGAALTNYGELKNQYGLINASGQILVSETDAANYMASDNLEEFLDKYGVLSPEGTGETVQVKNPLYDTAWDEYNEEYQKWQAEKPDPANPIYVIPGEVEQSSDLYDSFLWATAICYGSAMVYLAQKLGLPGETLYDKDGNPVVSYNQDGWKAYTDDNSGSITSEGSGGLKDCYSHVLDHLLPIGSYTTTTGQTVDITSGNHWWGTGSYNDRGGRAAELAELIRPDAETVLYACGDTGADITADSSEIEKLMSDYYIDANGQKQIKTLQQKIVDLDYANSSGILSDQELYDALQHFVNDDLSVLKKGQDKFDEDAYNADVEEWQAKKPQEPDVEMYIDKIVRTVTDSDKAQWYINLWHRMNGESDFKAGFGSSDEYDSSQGFASVSKTDQKWAVLKDNEMNSSQWLQFALQNGVITLEQVQFTNSSQEGTGVQNIQWTSIIWTSSADITEQKDNTAVTKAEVEYNKALSEIESKDKEYDNTMKKLDTEHKALETEYESIKNVIQKNVERTFKVFS